MPMAPRTSGAATWRRRAPSSVGNGPRCASTPTPRAVAVGAPPGSWLPDDHPHAGDVVDPAEEGLGIGLALAGDPQHREVRAGLGERVAGRDGHPRERP